MEKSYLKEQIPIAGTIYIGQMVVGYSMGWTAPIIPKLQNLEESPLPEPFTDTTASCIGSVLYIGCIIGPHVTGYLSNIIGRRPCLLLGGIITALSYALFILSSNLTMIFLARIIKGFGIGVISIGNIVYIGEVASTNIRGILLTAIGVAGTFGTLLVYSTGPYVSFAGTAWIGLGISLTYISLVPLMVPESPIYHVIKGNHSEAKIIFIKLGRAEETDDALATKPEKEKKMKGSMWKELFTVRCNRRALILLLTLGVCQQLSGVVAMVFFITTIFGLAGSSIPPHIATICIGITQLASCGVAPLFVEWSGRRKLLIISTSVCCMSLAVLGGYFFLNDLGYPAKEKFGWLPLVTLIIFFLFYDFGFGVIPSTLTGEMFRSNVRSTGSAVTSTLGWLIGFAVSSAFGYMLAVGGHFTFWFFAAACASAGVFTVFYVPETKGKTLVEIQEMLEK